MSREEVRHVRRSAPAASVRGWEMCGCVKLLLESSGSSRRRRLFEAFFLDVRVMMSAYYEDLVNHARHCVVCKTWFALTLYGH